MVKFVGQAGGIGEGQVSSEAEVSNPEEIVFLLRQLIKNKELFSISFNQGEGNMSTLLLDISPKQGVLLVDGSREAAINQQVVNAGRLQFTGRLRGAKVQFVVLGSRVVDYQGASALAVKIPEVLQYHQNRGSFRVQAQSATYCLLSSRDGSQLKVPVDELSVGGVQLVLGYDAPSFSIGQKLVDCQLDLGGLGTVVCQLEVCSNKQITSRFSGLRAIGVGCRFVGLPRSDEARVSRFVIQQERQLLGRDNPFSQ